MPRRVRTEYLKKYRLEHLDTIKRQQHQWYLNNASKLKEKHYTLYHTNIYYKLVKNLRRRVHQVISGKTKYSNTLHLLGCNILELQLYLEKQFKPGMSWSNYGKWHIDHIKPCASFDLTKSEEQQKCFHYTNLQPLWAQDNLSKGKRESRR